VRSCPIDNHAGRAVTAHEFTVRRLKQIDHRIDLITWSSPHPIETIDRLAQIVDQEEPQKT